MSRARQNLVKRARRLLDRETSEPDSDKRFVIAREKNRLIERMTESTREREGFVLVGESQEVQP